MRRAAAYSVTGMGYALVVCGLALVYPPAAVVAAGVGLVWVGLFALEVKP